MCTNYSYSVDTWNVELPLILILLEKLRKADLQKRNVSRQLSETVLSPDCQIKTTQNLLPFLLQKIKNLKHICNRVFMSDPRNERFRLNLPDKGLN